MQISSEGMGIVLRILEEDDLPDVTEAANDRSIHEGAPLVPYPYTYMNAAELLAGARKGLLEGSAYHMCIRTIDGGFVGMCALYEVDRGSRNAQVGYWIRSSMRGRGYGRGAVDKLAIKIAQVEKIPLIITKLDVGKMYERLDKI